MIFVGREANGAEERLQRPLSNEVLSGGTGVLPVWANGPARRRFHLFRQHYRACVLGCGWMVSHFMAFSGVSTLNSRARKAA